MRNFFYKYLLFISFFAVISIQLFADPPGPPSPGGDPTTERGSRCVGGREDPSGAPIGDGIGIILVLSVIYGTWKIYSSRKENTEIQDE